MNKLERKTYITYNDDMNTATILTYSRKLKNQLSKLAAEYPDQVGMNSEAGTLEEYWVPKDWVKIKPPRKYTAEQLAAARENARRMSAKKKERDG